MSDEVIGGALVGAWLGISFVVAFILAISLAMFLVDYRPHDAAERRSLLGAVAGIVLCWTWPLAFVVALGWAAWRTSRLVAEAARAEVAPHSPGQAATSTGCRRSRRHAHPARPARRG